MAGLQENIFTALKPQELATIILILTEALALSNFNSAN